MNISKEMILYIMKLFERDMTNIFLCIYENFVSQKLDRLQHESLGPMLGFFKYFRRKNRQKWRF
jgi:hypothetical protein